MLLSSSRWAAKRASSILPSRVCVSEEVRTALAEGRGVVALESTVITHGLPRPHNFELATNVQSIVRSHGAVPATIALIDGKAHIGLSDEQLQRISDDMDSVKVSKRDIPYALVNELIGGTTVAATMYLAHTVGIRVFATGGIGGVHRGVMETYDISADLMELSQTPVAVVCAGIKSILDVQKSLEYLETKSVATIVYGNKINFPGFFTAETVWKALTFTTSIDEIADILNCSREMGIMSGSVIGCPIPQEHEADGQLINEAIEVAIMEAKELGVSSKNVTPFLLKRVSELTHGISLKTNLALLENNAHVGAQLANILAHKSKSVDEKQTGTPITSASTQESNKDKKPPSVVVIGASILDLEAITNLDVHNDGGSYPGTLVQRCGGVGRNHADALARLGINAQLISAVGNDPQGEYIRDRCSHMDFSNVISANGIQTATYTAFTVKGNVQYGVSTIEPIIERITPDLIRKNENLISDADFVVLDGNVSVDTIKEAVTIADFYGTKVWYEPTDILKMRKIFDAEVADKIDCTSPNINEFFAYCNFINQKLPEEYLEKGKANRLFDHVWDNADRYMRSLDALVISVGPEGTLVLKREGSEVTRHQLDAPLQPDVVVSPSGAGDCFNSGLLGGRLFGWGVDKSLRLAQRCAAASLQSIEAVPSSINELRPL